MDNEPYGDQRDAAPERYPGDLPPRLGGLCAYLVGWVSGLIVFFTQDDQRVRFHAAQSVIVFGGLFAFLFVWSVISPELFGAGLFGGMLSLFSSLLIWGLSLALWGFLCYQGYHLSDFKVPIAGTLAERWEARQLPLR